MIKLLGSVMVLLASTGIGFLAGEKKKERNSGVLNCCLWSLVPVDITE